MREGFLLGIDGGGTHTRAALADGEGRILAEARGDSINPRHVDGPTLQARLGALLDGLLKGRGPVQSAFLALGGVSTSADARVVEAQVAPLPALKGARLRVANDAVAALSGGLSGGPGMVLIAGTGSACFGRGPDGTETWCGGWEALADDAGSAHGIALEAVKAAVRMEDGRLPATPLRDLVFQAWDLPEPRALAAQLGALDRTALAQLAPAVVALAERDASARALVDRAVQELTGLVQTTAHRLFGQAPCDLVLVGGLALSGPPFTPWLEASLRIRVPQVRVVPPALTPLQGAVLEARRLAEVPA